MLTFLEVGFGGNLVQGFRVYAWRAVPSFPQIELWVPSLALRPQPFWCEVPLQVEETYATPCLDYLSFSPPLAPVIFPPMPFSLMCPAFAARYLEANIVFSPFLPSILLCNLCVVIVYVFSSCLHFHFSILDSFIDFVFDCLTNFTVMFWWRTERVWNVNKAEIHLEICKTSKTPGKKS